MHKILAVYSLWQAAYMYALGIKLWGVWPATAEHRNRFDFDLTATALHAQTTWRDGNPPIAAKTLLDSLRTMRKLVWQADMAQARVAVRGVAA